MAQKVSFLNQRPTTTHSGLNGNSDPSPYVGAGVDPALTPFKCRRSSCAQGLGLTDGNELYLDGVIISRNTLLICTRYECGHESQWRPQQKGTVVRRDKVRRNGIETYFQELALPVVRYTQLHPVNCIHCEKRIGFSDGSRFYAAEVLIPHRVEYECLYCGERGIWRPMLKPCPC